MLWLSLGENGLADEILQRHGRKSFNTPYSFCRSNVDHALQLERDGYEQLLDPTQLTAVEVKGQRVVRSRSVVACAPVFSAEHSRGFEFTHHDPGTSEQDRQTLRRRIDRLNKIRCKQDIVFLYHHQQHARSCPDLVREKLALFAGLYRSVRARCHVVMFHQAIAPTPKDRHLHMAGATEGVFDFAVHSLKPWNDHDPSGFGAREDDDLLKALFGRVDSLIR